MLSCTYILQTCYKVTFKTERLYKSTIIVYKSAIKSETNAQVNVHIICTLCCCWIWWNYHQFRAMTMTHTASLLSKVDLNIWSKCRLKFYLIIKNHAGALKDKKSTSRCVFGNMNLGTHRYGLWTIYDSDLSRIKYKMRTRSYRYQLQVAALHWLYICYMTN